jgi:hypothetical protein
MAELYAVEVPKAPVHEKRFATFFGNQYSSFRDIHFVELSKVIMRDRAGNLTSRKGLSLCRRIVDDLQRAVKDGWSQKFLASARVVKYLEATNSFEVVYSGPEGPKAAEDLTNIPKVAQAADGRWHVVPTTGFTRGQREWNYKHAFMDSRGEPRSIHLTYPTLPGLIQLMFDSTFPIHQEMVAQFPLAAAADIPQPPTPVVEHVPTVAELAAVKPFPVDEYNRMPSEEYKKRHILEPLFREAIRKMFDVENVAKAEFARKEAAEAEQKSLNEMRKKLEGDAAHGW